MSASEKLKALEKPLASKAEAENAKLREALERIAGMAWDSSSGRKMRDIARDALNSEPYADIPGAGQRGC